MWMTDYVREIQNKLIIQYGFSKGENGLPKNVPDGIYPMVIDGKTDNVKIIAGEIFCCNFEKGRTP